jgi:hypothetical protein
LRCLVLPCYPCLAFLPLPCLHLHCLALPFPCFTSLPCLALAFLSCLFLLFYPCIVIREFDAHMLDL